jgi:hypothetical protein
VITWHTTTCHGGLRSVAYCRVGSTVLRRTTCEGDPTEWATAEADGELEDLVTWTSLIEEHEWTIIDRDEAGRLLGVVTAETITDEQIEVVRGDLMAIPALEMTIVQKDLLWACSDALGDNHLTAQARRTVTAAYNTRFGWLP